MLIGFVGRAVKGSDTHDDQFAHVAGQGTELPNGSQVVQPAAGDCGAVQQHLVQMKHAAPFGNDAVHQGTCFGMRQIGVGKTGHGRSRELKGLQMHTFEQYI
ncbi:hypothetical protein D3C72_1472790 [compost metagenome]